MRFATCVLVVFLPLFVSHPFPARAEQAVLRVGVETMYAPFVIPNADGTLSGFDVDIARALCRELELTCDVRPLPFETLLPQLVSGELDIAVAGMAPTDERRKQVLFTDKYFRSRSIFIRHEHAGPGGSVKDIAGKRVGVQAGTIQEEYLRQVHGDSIVVVEALLFNDVFELLRQNKADLIFVDGLPGYAYLKSDKGADFESMGPALEPGAWMDQACIAVSKKQPKLRQRINEALKNLRRTGVYGKINRKYFDFSIF